METVESKNQKEEPNSVDQSNDDGGEDESWSKSLGKPWLFFCSRMAVKLSKTPTPLLLKSCNKSKFIKIIFIKCDLQT